MNSPTVCYIYFLFQILLLWISVLICWKHKPEALSKTTYWYRIFLSLWKMLQTNPKKFLNRIILFCEYLIRMWFSTTLWNFNTVRKSCFFFKPHVFYSFITVNAKTKILFSLLSVNKTFPELFNFLTNSNHFYVFIIFLSTVKFQRETLFMFMFAFI